MRKSSKSRLLISGTLIGVSSLLMVGCSGAGSSPQSQGSESSAPSELFNQEAHDLLPDEIQKSGTLSNFMQIPNEPLEYMGSDGNPEGIDPELISAISEVLGVSIKTETTKDFAALLPALDTARADIVFSAMLDKPERVEAGYGFTDYFQTYTGFLISAENADKYQEFSDFCGTTMTSQAATSYIDHIKEISKKYCESKGLDPIEALGLDSNPQGVIQVLQERTSAQVMGREYMQDQMDKHPDQLAVVEALKWAPANYGVVALDSNKGILDAFSAAFDVLYENGQYQEILGKYGLENSGLDSFPVVVS